MLIPLKVETVIECLSHESNEWDSLATQYSSKEDVALAGLPYETISEIYSKGVFKISQPVPIDHMVEISKSMGIDAEQYRHCDYQVAIAAIVSSH